MPNWNQIIDKLDYAFQPIIYSHTGKLYAVEALIRNVQNIPSQLVRNITRSRDHEYAFGRIPNIQWFKGFKIRNFVIFI